MESNNKIDESFNFSEIEIDIVHNNRKAETKIGFAVLYKFFQNNGRFPYDRFEISNEVICYISEQIGVDSSCYNDYDWNGKSIINHRKQIRELFLFRECTVQDYDTIKIWILSNVLPKNDDSELVKKKVYKQFKELKIEPTTPERIERIERIVSSAVNTYENNIFESIFNKLTVETIKNFDLFLATESQNNNMEQIIWFNDFNIDPDGANIKSVFNESNKLKTIEGMMIPEDIFKDIPSKLLKKYYKRSKAENISEFKRHPDAMRNGLLAIFFHFKSMEIKDILVDLLIKILNNLDTSANRKIKKELAESTNYTRNKNKLLLKIAKAN